VHVLIIGGGTGGMCLAHGLKRAGISVSVYERDRTRSDGLHGYRVGIDPTGNQARWPPNHRAASLVPGRGGRG
jgi:2-polyprenyl-6-methoxyphenol hydroxylase-like FAD-dependent oxidoreductase